MSDREVSTLKLRTDGNTERLHKVLATSGFGSRRKLEERILQGEVQLNGSPAELGSVVKPGDRVEMDDKKLIIRAAPGRLGQVLMYHKPEGELSARVDPEGRPTVFERLPFLKGARWIAVGRLDFNTTGLLMFTTDGDLANLLMHPSGEMEREYVARAYVDDPDELPAIVERLREPIELEDGPAQFDDVELIGASAHNALFKVSLREGRNREVRRMFAALGMEVGRLKRTRYGPIELPKTLLRSNYQTMSPEQATELAEAAGMETKGAQLIAELEATMRRRERQILDREKEKGTRHHGPFRPPQPQAVVDADEFSLGQGRPESDNPRGRRRPDSRRPRPGSRGPRPATPGQRERAPSARKTGGGRSAAGPRGQGRGDAQPRGQGQGQRGAGQGQGQRGPGKPRGRRTAEFHGPMDYANGPSLLDDKPISEADDNRGNSIAAGETHLGNQDFQSDAWRPVWPPTGDDQQRPPARGRSRNKKRPGAKPRGGRPNPQANAEPGNNAAGAGAGGNASPGNAGESRPERSGRGRRRRGRPGGPQSNRSGSSDRGKKPESGSAEPGNSAAPGNAAPQTRRPVSADGEQAKKPARRRTRKPKPASEGGGDES